jgi:hypothetical protein
MYLCEYALCRIFLKWLYPYCPQRLILDRPKPAQWEYADVLEIERWQKEKRGKRRKEESFTNESNYCTSKIHVSLHAELFFCPVGAVYRVP